MSTYVLVIWIFLCVLIGYNLVLPIIFFVCYKLIPKRTANRDETLEADYAIIVTAYQQADQITSVVNSLLNLDYSNYLIYVVADNCDVSAIHFEDERVVLLKPETVLKSNTRSHLYAINHFKRAHELLTIVDSDNLVHPQYLNELNYFFRQGYKAVQGVRKAKNLDSLYACIDAVQDIYYHLYDREILFALGSSATLAGSGMAFESELYQNYLRQNDVKGAGFDKVLQLEIVGKGYRIAFAKNAIVYDEKTSRSDQLVKQRARWFNTWFKYAGFGFTLIWNSLVRTNWNGFLFGLMFVRPPLFLLVVAGVLMMIASFFINSVVFIAWAVAFLLFAVALLVALVHSRADQRIYRSLTAIPLFVFHQLRSLFKAKKANEISVATEHYHHKEVEDLT